jgi:uncharacterized spore protein YtfJ
MAEERTPNAEKIMDATDSIDAAQQSVDKLMRAARVEAVYGEPVQKGDMTVIPSAEVLGFLGFMYGTGGGKWKTERDEAGAAPNLGGGGGGGGWGRTLSRPVAAIVISPDDVRVEPIVDVTKVWMAALTTVGFVIGMMARMSRRRRARRNQ